MSADCGRADRAKIRGVPPLQRPVSTPIEPGLLFAICDLGIILVLVRCGIERHALPLGVRGFRSPQLVVGCPHIVFGSMTDMASALGTSSNMATTNGRKRE